MSLKNGQDIKVLDDVVFVFLTYNQEKYIPETLTSAFNQSCYPSTLLIMDDASPDNSDSVIRALIATAPPKLNIEYLHNTENVGLVGQLNKLVGRFENKLIVLQAGDDDSYPNRLEETYNAWIESNKPSLLLANYDKIDEQGNVIRKFDYSVKPPKKYTLKRIIDRKALVYGCCAAFDSDLLNFFGKIPEDVINEDRVNIFRAFFRNGAVYIHKPLLRYRSEIGISTFNQKTKEARFDKITQEAKRELSDLECHLHDLDKIGSNKAKELLLKRKKLIVWLIQIKPTLSFFEVLGVFFKGVSLAKAWKVYKKIKIQ
jgi:glycosyltransferase involved in cell wall biosynthesis